MLDCPRVTISLTNPRPPQHGARRGRSSVATAGQRSQCRPLPAPYRRAFRPHSSPIARQEPHYLLDPFHQFLYKDSEKSCCGKSCLPGASAGEPFPVRVPAKEAAKSGSSEARPTGTSAGAPVPVRVPAAAETSLRSSSSSSTSTFETRPGKQLSRIAVNTG